MKINNETVIGYNRVADMGLTVFTQSETHSAGDCTYVLMTFDNKEECDAYQLIVDARWQRHIKSLREGYMTVVR